MRKLFTVIAIVSTMFTVVKASEAPVLETKIYQIAEKRIIHENPNYTEVFIYSDIACTKLVEIITVNKNDGTVVNN
jgi:hypothetical protein